MTALIVVWIVGAFAIGLIIARAIAGASDGE